MKTELKPNQNIAQIRDAILKVWPHLPEEFNGWLLWGKVRKRLPYLDVYQDTILHTMREMNRRGLIGYECLNRTKSLYKKLKS